RSSVVFATFIVVLVFVPVFFLTGLQGRLFAPLGYAYVLAVLASLGVALTVTPALAAWLLPRAAGAAEPPLVRRLHAVYERLVRGLDGQFPLVMVVTAVLLAAAAWAAGRFWGECLPGMRENHVVVHMRGVPGTSLTESLAAGNRVTSQLQARPEVLSVAQQVGRAELSEDTSGVEDSELEVDLRPAAAEDVERTQRQLKDTLRDVPGYSFEVFPFLSERIHETLTGTTAALAVKVYGDDLDANDRTAEAVARLLNGIPGHDNVRVEPQVGTPELVVRVRPEDVARYSLRNSQVLDAVHAAFQARPGRHVCDPNGVVDLVLTLRRQDRADAEAVANLWLSVPNPEARAGTIDPGAAAGRIQLRQVADVYLADGRFLVAREGGGRRSTVTCNVQGRDV